MRRRGRPCGRGASTQLRHPSNSASQIGSAQTLSLGSPHPHSLTPPRRGGFHHHCRPHDRPWRRRRQLQPRRHRRACKPWREMGTLGGASTVAAAPRSSPHRHRAASPCGSGARPPRQVVWVDCRRRQGRPRPPPPATVYCAFDRASSTHKTCTPSFTSPRLVGVPVAGTCVWHRDEGRRAPRHDTNAERAPPHLEHAHRRASPSPLT